jgi:3-hexulose-6-phosphate synthase/6-phospho-3-hexuloisomerase
MAVPQNYRNYDATQYVKEELRPFLDLTTPVVTDAMNRLGAMYGIHNLFQNSGMKMVGTAFTCRIQHGDWLWVCKACDAMNEGDVLIIDMGGTESVGCWGDLSNAGLMNRRGTGVIVDGGIRDIEDLLVMKVPTYYRSIGPNAGNPHEEGGTMGIPVVCGGQPVHPGDVIFGDDSGVVVIPKDKWQEVLIESKKQEEYEKETANRIYSGGPCSSYDK